MFCHLLLLFVSFSLWFHGVVSGFSLSHFQASLPVKKFMGQITLDSSGNGLLFYVAEDAGSITVRRARAIRGSWNSDEAVSGIDLSDVVGGSVYASGDSAVTPDVFGLVTILSDKETIKGFGINREGVFSGATLAITRSSAGWIDVSTAAPKLDGDSGNPSQLFFALHDDCSVDILLAFSSDNTLQVEHALQAIDKGDLEGCNAIGTLQFDETTVLLTRTTTEGTSILELLTIVRDPDVKLKVTTNPYNNFGSDFPQAVPFLSYDDSRAGSTGIVGLTLNQKVTVADRRAVVSVPFEIEGFVESQTDLLVAKIRDLPGISLGISNNNDDILLTSSECGFQIDFTSFRWPAFALRSDFTFQFTADSSSGVLDPKFQLLLTQGEDGNEKLSINFSYDSASTNGTYTIDRSNVLGTLSGVDSTITITAPITLTDTYESKLDLLVDQAVVQLSADDGRFYGLVAIDRLTSFTTLCLSSTGSSPVVLKPSSSRIIYPLASGAKTLLNTPTKFIIAAATLGCLLANLLNL